jgi:MbtH protein
MAWDEDETTMIYHVVVNHEEQYSIWPEYKAVPKGWKTVGRTGQKQECLDYIKDVWTDIRPLSLRKAMAENAELSDIGATNC